jgi:leucyl-tRNA synthetase
VKTVQKSDQVLHQDLIKTVQKVSKDLDSFKFNTAVAALMTFLNSWEEVGAGEGLDQTDLEIFLKILAPFAPHLAEELWSNLTSQTNSTNLSNSIHSQSWPMVNFVARETGSVVVVAINGKPRGTLNLSTLGGGVPDEAQLVSTVQTDQRWTKYFAGKKILKTIYVPGKILNFVTQHS